jgi:hypothetical protein
MKHPWKWFYSSIDTIGKWKSLEGLMVITRGINEWVSLKK